MSLCFFLPLPRARAILRPTRKGFDGVPCEDASISFSISIFFLLFLLLLCPIGANGQAAGGDALATSTAPVRPEPTQITPQGRIKWVFVSTFGPISLLNGATSSAWNTGLDSPKEYGPHWDGFAKRYGMRFTGVGAGNALEAGVGAIWGEDPRYFPTSNAGFGTRVKHIFAMTVLARNRDGQLHLAYARFIAIPSANFLSNTWRVPSDSTATRALERSGYGFLGVLGTNAFL